MLFFIKKQEKKCARHSSFKRGFFKVHCTRQKSHAKIVPVNDEKKDLLNFSITVF